ncbi:putative Cytochrome P450 [Seiridium cardinale]
MTRTSYENANTNLAGMMTPSLIAGALMILVWRCIRAWRQRLNFPILGSQSGANYADAVLEGHKKYPDSPFILDTSPPRIIMPMSMFKEAMHAPSKQLSFMRSIYATFQGRYTYVGTEIDDIIHAIRSDLTKRISDILPLLQNETEYCLEHAIGEATTWTSVPAYVTMVRMIAILSGRVFVGLPLSREEKWIQKTMNYTSDIGNLLRAAHNWNHVIRPFILPFLPETRRVVGTLHEARALIQPVADEALRHHDEQGDVPVKAGLRGSFISWMMRYQSAEQRTAERTGINQMILSFVALHTTSAAATFVLLDLAQRPEYIPPLRQEIEDVIREEGWCMDENQRRHLNKARFQRMTKLDSFIKESQRVNPLNIVEGWRVVLSDITFSNGVKIPKGSNIAWPLWGVYNSESTALFNREYNKAADVPGPEVFDGFRFSKLRQFYQTSGQKHSTVTTSEESLNFGHGPNSCPGRFFAIYEIKTILVNIILNYDFRLKDGKKPQHTTQQIYNSPDASSMLEFKRRIT